LSFVLHPSGYCVWYSPGQEKNLQKAIPCPECRRVAGHAPDCSLAPDPDLLEEKDYHPKSRAKLYDAVSVLWSKSPEKSFITFTLPSHESKTIVSLSDRASRSQENRINSGTYQCSTTDPDTGDLAIAQAFSRTLEAWKKKTQRESNATSRRSNGILQRDMDHSRGLSGKILSRDRTPTNPGHNQLSYVWAAEAQMKRKEKYGGVGDLHYHLVVNQKLKHDNGNWHDYETFQWLQDNWNSQLGTSARNCVDVKPIPERITSIPSYLSKYLGKGHQRRIVSRSFQATQDLTCFAPIHLNAIPEATMTRETNFTSKDGYNINSKYFHTREILEQYAHFMREAATLKGSTPGEGSLTRHGQAMDRINAKLFY
jgi:hypothetical protein